MLEMFGPMPREVLIAKADDRMDDAEISRYFSMAPDTIVVLRQCHNAVRLHKFWFIVVPQACCRFADAVAPKLWRAVHIPTCR